MGASLHMNWEKRRLEIIPTGKTINSALMIPPERGACQFHFPESYRCFTVVVNRDRCVPYLDPLVAEVLGPGNEAGLPDQRQADKLSGNTYYGARLVLENNYYGKDDKKQTFVKRKAFSYASKYGNTERSRL